MADAPQTDTQSLQPYLDAGYQLIPLFKWDRTSTHKNGRPRQDGKRPMDGDWTNRRYDNAEVVEHVRKGSNAGVRLTAGQMVVDVDPRNFPEGRDSFAELCEATGLDPSEYPRVETGSGGLHVYMTKSEDVAVVDSLEGYPGVEFKTRGRQVVSAGSVHPNGSRYEWDFLGPELRDAGPAPDRLMAICRRPTRTAAAQGGGEYDQQQIADMLDRLDPEDFRDHEAWLQLMQACHHASGGDARSEFIEWSTRDPEYADDAWIIGRRWDSLHRSKDGPAVTHRTLHKVLRDRGAGDAVPSGDVGTDFDDDIELPGDEDIPFDLPEHERKGPLERMNERLWAVLDGGKFRIMEKFYDPSIGRTGWTSMTKRDFEDFWANRRVEKLDKKGNPTAEPIAKEWLNWARRRTARAVIFDPEREHKGLLNLWTGWGVEPKPGDWSLTQELIRDVLCDGDGEASRFVLDWMAYMVQKPYEPAEVAICFHGDKGTGKSTLGEALVRLSGAHGMTITSPKHLTGNFNAHLMDVIMVFADEGVRPTSRDDQNTLKALITEREAAYEPKGIDVRRGQNRAHVMIASNDDWFVPMGLVDGERRFFVSRANNSRRDDVEFFGALKRQLYDEGGLGAMLHDLKLRDIGDWAPRGNIPKTAAAAEQKLRNMEPLPQWWFNALEEGAVGFEWARGTDDWERGPVRAFLQDVKEDFEAFCHRARINPAAMNKGIDRYFAAELRKVCPGVRWDLRDQIPSDRLDVKEAGHSGRARSMEFPSLDECRRQFEEAAGLDAGWSDPDPLDL